MHVNFGEAASLAATGNAAENLAILKRLAGTMMRIDLGGIRKTAKRRRQAASDDSWTIRLLSKIFDFGVNFSSKAHLIMLCRHTLTGCSPSVQVGSQNLKSRNQAVKNII